jgi:hypothetical protein
MAMSGDSGSGTITVGTDTFAIAGGTGIATSVSGDTLTINATSDPVITLAGDLSGSVTLTNLGNGTLTATVADDSHNHTVANVDGLQAALDLKATLASPTLTGAPIAPTAAANTNTTQIATTAYVQTELTDLIGGAPGTLDTLNELAEAINDDASYSSTLTTALATKTAKTSNQSLGSAANVMTISGHTITLARGDSTTDTVTVPDNNTTYSVGDGGLTQVNFTTADNSKLDAIEASATADQTNAEIAAAVEAATDSNTFTDADHSKLNAIEASATADQTNAEIAAAVEAATDSNTFTDADHSKLNAIEAGATADQTSEEIQDIVGAMVSGNTESGITVTYQDADGTLDFAVTSDPTLTLSGDASGSATFTNLGNATLSVVVADDSHNHVVSNVDGLQAALDAKTTPGYVDTQITNLIGGAPGTLDTLNELAEAINDDSNYSSTLTTALATKTAKTSNQSLGTATNVMTISGHTITLARGDSTTDTVTVPDNNTTYSVGDGGLTQINFTSADNTKLDGIATSANNYSHPTSFAGDDISVDTGALSGAVVISDLDFNVTTDTAGHVTDANGTVSTRTLTLANLGYTGATNANYITNNSSLTNGAGYITGYTNTTYSPGAGLDLSGTTFSVERDLRDVDYVGMDSTDYIHFSNNSSMEFYVNGGERLRLGSNGDLHADGDVIAYSTTISDERLKTGIMPIPNALEKVNQLTGCTFTYLSDGRKSAGLIAQDVEKVLPSAVSEKELPLKMDDGEKYKVLQYDQTIGLLVEAIKELSAKVEKLEEN